MCSNLVGKHCFIIIYLVIMMHYCTSLNSIRKKSVILLFDCKMLTFIGIEGGKIKLHLVVKILSISLNMPLS